MVQFLNRFSTSDYLLTQVEKDFLIGEYRIYSARPPRKADTFLLKHVRETELDPAQLGLIYQLLAAHYPGVEELVSINNRNLSLNEMQLVFTHHAPFSGGQLSEAELWRLAHQIAQALQSLEAKGLYYPNVSRRYVGVDGANFKLLSPFAFPGYLREMFNVMANPVAPMSQRHQLFSANQKKNLNEYCAMLAALAGNTANEAHLASDRGAFLSQMDSIGRRHSSLFVFFLKQMADGSSFQSVLAFMNSNSASLPPDFQEYLRSPQAAASSRSLSGVSAGISTLNPPTNPYEPTRAPVVSGSTGSAYGRPTPTSAHGGSVSGQQSGPGYRPLAQSTNFEDHRRHNATPVSTPELPPNYGGRTLHSSMYAPGPDNTTSILRTQRFSEQQSISTLRPPNELRATRYSAQNDGEHTQEFIKPVSMQHPSVHELAPNSSDFQSNARIMSSEDFNAPREGKRQVKVSYRMNATQTEMVKIIEYEDGTSETVQASDKDMERIKKSYKPSQNAQPRAEPGPSQPAPSGPVQRYQLFVVKDRVETLLFQTTFQDRRQDFLTETNQRGQRRPSGMGLGDKSRLRSVSNYGTVKQSPYYPKSYQNIDERA